MPQQIEQLKIFLASPGDVGTEREQARQAVNDINRTIGRDKGVHLDVIGWDTDARPGYGSDAQELLNGQIADMDQYDLFVGIMWNRFGQPTPRAESGTEEEFNRAAAAFEHSGRPEIMLYFSQSPSNLATADQLAQKAKVLQFKDRVRGKAVTWDYAGPQEFQPVFHRQLSQWILNRRQETPKAPVPLPGAVAPLPSGSAVPTLPPAQQFTWVLLNETFYRAASVNTDADGRVSLRIPPHDTEEEALLNSLNPQQYRQVGSVPYAHRNDGGLVQVVDVKKETKGDATTFLVELKMSNESRGGMMEAGINGMTPDELAELRARLLLLNELPAGQRPNDPFSIMHFVSGFNNAVRVEKGIFPDLWSHLNSQPDLFVPLARLVAVYNLKASNTVEQILELTLGPVEGTTLPVHFRGQRRRAYTNASPAVIEVSGRCELK